MARITSSRCSEPSARSAYRIRCCGWFASSRGRLRCGTARLPGLRLRPAPGRAPPPPHFFLFWAFAAPPAVGYLAETGLPGSPQAANSSTALRVDRTDSLAFRLWPDLRCLRLRRFSEDAVLEATV